MSLIENRKMLLSYKNLSEFKDIKKLIYFTSTKESQLKALERLKIMKLRTPLLPAGLEGTYILLQALLSNSSEFSDTEIQHIYSTAVLRFLNICDSINKKQGTFYETAKKSKLPSWIISIRHDIAHGHTMPSKFMLELALNELLKFIKTKYWDIEELYVNDFISSSGNINLDIFYLYGQLVVNLYYNEDEEIINQICTQIKLLLGGVVKKIGKIDDPNFLKEITENYMEESESLLKHYRLEISEHLVSSKLMLCTNLIYSENKKRISFKFCKIWYKLLTLLYAQEILMVLVNKLYDFINESKLKGVYKDIASCWIKKIFLSLHLTKTIKENYEDINKIHSKKLVFMREIEKNDKFKDTIIFADVTKLPIDKAINFEKRIIETPNMYSLEFLEQVLMYNGRSSKHIKDVVSKFNTLLCSQKIILSNKIHGLSDLEYINDKNDLVTQSGPKRGPPDSLSLPLPKKFVRCSHIKYFKNTPLGIIKTL